MNKFLARHVLCLVVALSAATQALGSIQLQFTDSSFVGRIYDTTPSGDSFQAGSINELTSVAAGSSTGTYAGADLRDRTNSTLAGPFATAATPGLFTPTGVATINLGSQLYQYIYARYGRGSQPVYGAAVCYFADGISGDVEVPTMPPAGFGQNGISHVTAYNSIGSVPEPASLLAWGGLAMAATTVSLVRRKLKK